MTQDLTLARLPQIDPDLLLAHMSDPRIAAHLPLMPPSWDANAIATFVTQKEACWHRDGLGHWAFLHGDRYVGWGGFQKEAEDWDFGLVLTPDAFGLGARITRRALDFARADPRIPAVTFLLDPTRRSLGALNRLGATLIGPVLHDGARFLKYRLDTL